MSDVYIFIIIAHVDLLDFEVWLVSYNKKDPFCFLPEKRRATKTSCPRTVHTQNVVTDSKSLGSFAEKKLVFREAKASLNRKGCLDLLSCCCFFRDATMAFFKIFSILSPAFGISLVGCVFFLLSTAVNHHFFGTSI